MSRQIKKNLKYCFAAVAVLATASCGPLISFGDDGPADDVFTLRYEGGLKKESPSGPIVYVDSPQMVDGLDGINVAVRLDGNRRTVLAGSSWSAHLSDLVRDYVTLSLSYQSDANMIAEGGLDIKAGCRLGIKVWAMDFVPGRVSSEDQVELVMQFSLVRLSDSKLVSHPTFSNSVGVDMSDGRGVVAAFNKAMNVMANDYGRWFADEHRACAS